MTSSDPRVPPVESVTLSARLSSLADAASFAQSFCDRHAIDRERALRLRLVIEELFTNSIQHGYRVESDAPIDIALALVDEDAMELRYEDAAPRYDPRPRLSTPPAALTSTVGERPVGGLGVHLVGQLASAVRYDYQDGRNRLRLNIARPK